MTQFIEGQEVEVQTAAKILEGKKVSFDATHWCRAKIIYYSESGVDEGYTVEFADGTRAVFDANHVREDHGSEGQEVEVKRRMPMSRGRGAWCKAKIVRDGGTWGAQALPEERKNFWIVEFADGTRAVFDANHIRAFRSRLITNDPIDGYCPPVCDYEEMGR